MDELIKIDDRGLVNARELHEFLENKRQFADWIKQRIDQYGFTENEDYSISQICEKGHRPKTEYAISIDMAKELSMVENNEKGKAARKYFIQCEKQIKEFRKLSPMELLELQFVALKEQEQEISLVKGEVKDLKENMPLFNIDCEELQSTVRKIGIKVLGGKGSPAYKDKSIRTKVYSDIQHQIKREFGLNSYKAIKRSQLDIAKELVEKYEAPLVLKDEIYLANNQIAM